MSRAWGNGASIGSLVVFSDEADLQRIGNCWMNGRVKIGDVAMPIGHSGDCFYNYILVEVGGNFITGIPGSRFGAYFFGLPIESWKPDDREFHLLCAGESIIFPADIHKCTVPFISELNKIKEAALKTGGQTSCNKRLPGSQPKRKNKSGTDKVYYLLRPAYEDLENGGPGWYKLSWRPIWRNTIFVWAVLCKYTGLAGLRWYRMDANSGWGRYYKHLCVELGFLFFELNFWIKWDFCVHKDGPTDSAEKRPLELKEIRSQIESQGAKLCFCVSDKGYLCGRSYGHDGAHEAYLFIPPYKIIWHDRAGAN